jgi:hypothetical protein
VDVNLFSVSLAPLRRGYLDAQQVISVGQ